MTKGTAYLFLVILFFFLSNFGNAQSQISDSLRKALGNTRTPEGRVNTYLAIARNCDIYDSVLYYIDLGLEFCAETNYALGKARLHCAITRLSAEHSKFEEALVWGHKAASVCKSIQNDSLTAYAYLIIGAVQYEMATYDQAALSFHESLKYSEKNGYQKLMASAYNQLGLTHAIKKNRDYKMAFKYYLKAEELNLKTKNFRELGFVWLRMGAIYSAMKDFDNAEIYLSKALRLADSAGIITVQKWTLEAYSNLFRQQKKYNQALPVLLRSLQLSKQERQWSGIISSQSGIADLYSITGEHKKAMAYADSAIKNCLDSKVYSFLSIAYGCKSLVYERSGDYKNALEWYRKTEHIKDSLFKKANNENMNELEKKYETGKKEKELSEKNAELLIQKADNEKQQAQRNGFIIGTVLLLALLIFIFRGYRQKQKANELIARQKKEVEEQKYIIEEKQKEVMDSINYARRIQQAHLPSNKYIEKKLGELKRK
jgi:tetratricopeptide (TPR) repeat protein